MSDWLGLPPGEWINFGGVMRFMPAPIKPDPPKEKYRPDCGTYNGYNYHRRHGETPCMDCRNASRDYSRKRRKIVDVPPLKPHGTHSAYCRHIREGHVPCELCVNAERIYQREARRRQRAKKREGGNAA